jgi:hypothetical protein
VHLRKPALGGEAVILFERDEQKDKSGSADPDLFRGNAPIDTKTLFKLRIFFGATKHLQSQTAKLN